MLFLECQAETGECGTEKQAETAVSACLVHGSGSVHQLDVILHVLTGAGEGTRRLHFQGDQSGGGLKSGGNVLGQPLIDVPGKGGVAPPGPAGEVPCLDGTGVGGHPVVGQHLGVVGDEDLLGAPAVQELGGLRPIGEARQDLRCLLYTSPSPRDA